MHRDGLLHRHTVDLAYVAVAKARIQRTIDAR